MKPLTSTTATYGVPVFANVFETSTGGFTLSDNQIADGTDLAPGTVISYDESTRLAKVAKMAVLQADVTNSATAYRAKKGHNLKVGSSINLSGGTARAITAIDTGNADYDEFTVGTTIGVAATAGALLYVNDIGTSAPKGLLYLPVTVGVNTEIAVVIRGTVYENRIQPVPASIKALLPNIIFSKSF